MCRHESGTHPDKGRHAVQSNRIGGHQNALSILAGPLERMRVLGAGKLGEPKNCCANILGVPEFEGLRMTVFLLISMSHNSCASCIEGFISCLVMGGGEGIEGAGGNANRSRQGILHDNATKRLQVCCKHIVVWINYNPSTSMHVFQQDAVLVNQLLLFEVAVSDRDGDARLQTIVIDPLLRNRCCGSTAR